MIYLYIDKKNILEYNVLFRALANYFNNSYKYLLIILYNNSLLREV